MQDKSVPKTIIVKLYIQCHSGVIYYAVDATYELMEQRSFLAMCIKIAAYFVVLIGFLVFYKVIQPAKVQQDSSPEKEYDSDYSSSDYSEESQSIKLIERTL